MIEKQQEISTRRSGYKVYHTFLAPFSWYPKNAEAENEAESENWTIEEQETLSENGLVNTIKLTEFYEKNYFSNGC